ncbi:autophagy-type protein 22 [Clavulina sp. PMI_390]|nr:autophagy-type protein 22 [Clavulina sp. PMI_390]
MWGSFNKPLWGWYSYAFASEVFAVCSLSLFLPVCLEQFASDNGVLLPDKTIPCQLATDSETARCVVKFGWMWIDTASYSLYVFSASVATQAITVISLGGIADNPRMRKSILLLFAVMGSTASILFIAVPSSSSIWFMSALLAIIANVSFGVSMVCLNSYLPQLAKSDKEVQAAAARMGITESQSAEDAESRIDSANGTHEEEQSLLGQAGEDGSNPPHSQDADAYAKLLSHATSRISSRGIAIGYSSGISVLLLLLIPVTMLQGSTFSLRLSISISGAYWLFFTLPAMLWLPGKGTSGGGNASTPGDRLGVAQQILDSWRSLGQMLKPSEVRKLRNTFWFLFAWFILSDGFTTITSTAILFGKTSLHMGATSLMLIGAISPAAGVLGAIVAPIVQKRLDYSNLKMLVMLVSLAAVLPAYGCLGFLPIFGAEVTVNTTRFGGLTTPAEMYALGVYFGFLYGAFQSYARAVYSELIPPGEEARWYGLYSITDKSSSFFGPLVVGIIADATGNIRYAFFFLVFMMLIPIPILRTVDMAGGRRDAQKYIRSN